jgi:hypothetical protein
MCKWCFVGKLCDCSKTTVILGQVTPDNLERIRGAFQNADGDLMKALEANALPPIVQQRVVSMQTSDDEEQHELELLVGIVGLARNCLDKEQVRSVEESASRIVALDALSQINLRERFRNKKPVTVKESKQILEKAEQIRSYGSAAAFLWDLVKNLNDADSIRQRHFPNQMRIILPALESGNLMDQINQRNFGDLPPDVQAIFLDAAEKSPRAERSKYPIFTSWTDRGVDQGDEKEREPTHSNPTKIREEVDLAKAKKIELTETMD